VRAPEHLLLTCEHAGCRVPAELVPRFRGATRLLRSHRGWDPGAHVLARRLARALGAPLLAHTTSRLVADANRSPEHPHVLSERTRGLDPEARVRVLARHHAPHRRAVADRVAQGAARGGRVLHVAVHSFAPVLRGRERGIDVGILYDPARRAERELCAGWARILRASALDWAVRRNAPYRGVSDGLTRALRRRFSDTCYAGVELEVSQRLLHPDGPRARAAARCLAASLRCLLAGEGLTRRSAAPGRPSRRGR